MANEGEPRFLQLCFYDGKCETNMGQVEIKSSVDYKAFQTILGQKIGISPNQMSIYFVDGNNDSKPMHQRRILITGKSSFDLILQGKDCTVLVVLKRSRKDRRQRSKFTNPASYYFNVPQPNNFCLLSRNVNVPVYFACPVLPYYDQLAVQGLLNYNARLQNLCNYPKIIPEKRNNYSCCKECMTARSQGKAVQFHLCVNDVVTVSFRSSAGPVARPGSD
ncbi:hypothetical protein AgCh_013175 [Apium graveolens]